MDYIQTTNKQVDKFGAGKHGFKAGNPGTGDLATFLSNAWCDSVQQEIVNVIEAAGIVIAAGTLTQLRDAIRRFAGNNVTTVNAAASPFAVTAAHSGLIIVDASAGNVVLNLPAANSFAGLLCELLRIDTSVNTVTVNRAGADTIDGATSFTLPVAKAGRTIQADGVSVWRTPLNTDASMSSSGWQRLPSGLILQWGLTGNIANDAIASVTFPVAFPNNCFNVQCVAQNSNATVDNFGMLIGKTTTGCSLGRGFSPSSSGESNPLYWFAIGN